MVTQIRSWSMLPALACAVALAAAGCSSEQHTGQHAASSTQPARQNEIRTYTAPNGLFVARLNAGAEAVSGGRDRWWHVMTLSEDTSGLNFLDSMQYVFGTEMTVEERGMLVDDGNEEFILFMWVELIQPYLAKFGPNARTVYEHIEPRGDRDGVMAVMHVPAAGTTWTPDARPGEPAEPYDQLSGYYVWQENGVVMMVSIGHFYLPARVDQTRAITHIVGETRRLAAQVTVPPVTARPLPQVGRSR